MKKIKNCLLATTFILRLSPQLKSQNINYPVKDYVDYYNKDKDDFMEQIIGRVIKGQSEKNGYVKQKMGLTMILYEDKNNTNFHEFIRVLNCDRLNRLVMEDFIIDENTGLIDYNYRQYKLTTKKWNKYFAGRDYNSMIKNERMITENLVCQNRRFYPNLTKQEVYNLGEGERIKELVNAVQNRDEISNMLEKERCFWKSH